jgi:hypothetical protein
MNIEQLQITLFDMYDLRNALFSKRNEVMCPHESEATFGECLDDTINFLEQLETEMEGEIA